MVELFGVYALLLLAWGLWRAHAGGAGPEPPDDAPAPAGATGPRERGAAARRHLRALP